MYISVKGLAVDWTQSNEDLTMRLRIDKLKESDVKKLDIQFGDNDVSLKMPGKVFYFVVKKKYKQI